MAYTKEELTDSVAFIGEDDFGMSLKRILKQQKITAHIHFLPAINAEDYHRKVLAKTNQQDIDNKIEARRIRQ